jgi:hypothetical protein
MEFLVFKWLRKGIEGAESFCFACFSEAVGAVCVEVLIGCRHRCVLGGVMNAAGVMLWRETSC